MSLPLRPPDGEISMESPSRVEPSLRKRWFQFILILFLAQLFVEAMQRPTGYILEAIVPAAVARTIGVFIVAYPLSLFAKKENRFKVCCCIAAVIFCLISIGQSR